jgi:NAD(P) transhydrogenase subunit alpha
VEGLLQAARVLVMGAGVAGLQAIATARRLGAVVSAYDLRPAVKEQVQSLGGRFVELDLEVKDAQDAGGYAKAQDESFYQRQRELLGQVVAQNDVVITTAVVPGKKAPTLVTKEMVAQMAPGSVLVDLAAERGGNCELTRIGEKVIEHGVAIIGTINLASNVPYHASQMYAKNLTNFLLNMVKDGQLNLNMADDIVSSTLVTQGGEIVNPRIREFFSLPALVPKT